MSVKVSLLFLSLFSIFVFYAQGEIKETIPMERLSFSDDSFLLGHLLGLTPEKKLLWKHKSSSTPIEFDFDAIESISINRKLNEIKKQPEKDQLLGVHFLNGDYLRGSLLSLDQETLRFSTCFAEDLSVQVESLSHLNFLPSSYQVVFDSFTDYKTWKKSNSKSWSEEQGDLLSVFSGSTGTTLPELDAINIKFKAVWQRSFYLALRFFSDSDGGNYGNIGYHLSFSNHRINLQSNKNMAGRTVRETLGSKLVESLSGVKSAEFEIFAHRLRKEFVIKVNGKECARWQDSDSEYTPVENGILFINQGGNSNIRLQELSIAGWKGEFLPQSFTSAEAIKHSIIFKNGDSTEIENAYANDQNLTMLSKHGSFTLPVERIQRLNFPQQSKKPNGFQSFQDRHFTPNNQIFLERAQGKLHLELDQIKNNCLHGSQPSIGDLLIPLPWIKKIDANLSLKHLENYFEFLSTAQSSLQELKPDKALTLLNLIKANEPDWFWKRLSLLAQNLLSKEILTFSPHPNSALAKAKLGNPTDSILTLSEAGNISLWKNGKEIIQQHLESGNWPEFQRERNEGLRIVSITHPFWLGKTEVTHKEFERIMGTTQSIKNSSQLPVEVRLEEAVQFCTKLNANHPPPPGFIWRLPTEAEWEFACRAGSNGPYSGTKHNSLKPQKDAYEEHLDSVAWFNSNSAGKPKEVAQKPPNKWGFYDMHGNVSEWCLDSATQNKLSFINDRKPGLPNPISKQGQWPVFRGGSYQSNFSQCRSSYRDAKDPSSKSTSSGFRIALGLNLPTDEKKIRYDQAQAKKIATASGISMKEVKRGSFTMGSPKNEYCPGISIGPRGEHIYTFFPKGELQKYHLTNEKSTVLFETNSSILCISVSENGNFLLGGAQNGEIYCYDLVCSRLIQIFKDHAGPITSISIDPSSSSFASCGLDGKVVLRNLRNKELIWEVSPEEYPDSIEYLEFSRDSKYLLASGLYSSVLLFNVQNREVNKIWDKEKMLSLKAHWGPRGRFIYILHPGAEMTQLLANKQIPYRKIEFSITDAINFEITKDGKKILIISESGKCILRSLPINDSILIFHPDDKIEKSPDFHFYLSHTDVPPEDKNLISFLASRQNKDETFTTLGVSESPDGKWTTTTIDGELRIWNRGSQNFYKNLSGNMLSRFTDCAFSPDGSYLAGKLLSGHVLIYPSVPLEKIDLSELKKSYTHWFDQ